MIYKFTTLVWCGEKIRALILPSVPGRPANIWLLGMDITSAFGRTGGGAEHVAYKAHNPKIHLQKKDFGPEAIWDKSSDLGTVSASLIDFSQLADMIGHPDTYASFIARNVHSIAILEDEIVQAFAKKFT